jgi:hypothetical protein
MIYGVYYRTDDEKELVITMETPNQKPTINALNECKKALEQFYEEVQRYFSIS